MTAELISLTGSRMTLLAMPWLVLATTHSPALTGTVAAAETVPYVAAAALGSPLVDRFGARRVSCTADLLSAAPVGAIPFVYQSGFVVLVVLVMMAGTLRGFGDISKRVLLPMAVSRSGMRLIRATGLYDGISRLSALGGAAVGGVLIAWLGAPAVILIDAVSFVVCAVLVAGLVRVSGQHAAHGPESADEDQAVPSPAGEEEAGAGAHEPYLATMLGGIRYLRHDHLVLSIVIMMFAVNLFDSAALSVYIPVWAQEIIRSPVALGACSGAIALGATIGNIAFTAVAHRIARYLAFTVGFLVAGGPRFLALGLSHSVVIVSAVMFIAGLGLSTANPIIAAVMYERVPPGLHARVFGCATAVAFAGMPLGSLLAGVAVQSTSFQTAVLPAAALYLAITLIPVLGRRQWRQMNASAGQGSPEPGDERP